MPLKTAASVKNLSVQQIGSNSAQTCSGGEKQQLLSNKQGGQKT